MKTKNTALNLLNNIYIIHALKGYEQHEQRISKVFGSMELKYKLVTQGDPIHFSDQILHTYFTNNAIENTKTGILSCTLNHMMAYKHIADNNIEYAIVLENDPFFLGNIKENIAKLVPEINQLQKGFMISLENSTLRFPSYWQANKNQHIYPATRGRMAGAYIIDNYAAKQIVTDLETNKCERVVDWWHIDMLGRDVFKMYWAHPPLVEQGSHNGMLSSTISTKPKSTKTRIRWIIKKIYRMYIKRFTNEKRII